MVAYCNLCRAKRDLSKNVFLYKYPTCNADRIKEWKKNIIEAYKSVPLFKYEVKSHTRICSRHFLASDFQLVGEGRIHLTTTAIPTMFPDVIKYVRPREYYNPYGDIDKDDNSEDELIFKPQANNINRSKTKTPTFSFTNKYIQSSSESLLISNQKRNSSNIITSTRTATKTIESPVEHNEMPVIGIIVRANDLQVVEINRNRKKCRLCFILLESNKLTNVLTIEGDKREDLQDLFVTYFKLNLNNEEKLQLCSNCLQKCQNIIDLKNKLR